MIIIMIIMIIRRMCGDVQDQLDGSPAGVDDPAPHRSFKT